MIKLIDQIRKWKVDKNEKEIAWNELELLAIKFDHENEISWEKLNIEKEKAKLENEKQELIIKNIREDKIIKINEDLSLKINNISRIWKEPSAKLLTSIGIGREDANYSTIPEKWKIAYLENGKLTELEITQEQYEFISEISKR